MEINLKTVLLQTLCWWKGVVLLALAGALVLGCWGWQDAGRKVREEREAYDALLEEERLLKQEESETGEEAGSEGKSSLRDRLSEAERAEVDALVVQIEQLRQDQVYYDNSALMHLDPHEKRTLKLMYRISASDGLTQLVPNLLAQRLMDETWLDELARTLGYGSAIEIMEIIGTETAAADIPEDYAESSATFTVNFFLDSDESAETVQTLIDTRLTQIGQELRIAGYPYSMTFIQSVIRVSYDRDLETRQDTTRQGLKTQRDQIQTALDGFTDDQRSYASLLTGNSFLAGGKSSDSDDEDDESAETTQLESFAPSVSAKKQMLKYAVAGALLGLILGVGLLLLRDTLFCGESVCVENEIGRIRSVRPASIWKRMFYSKKKAHRLGLLEEPEASAAECAATISRLCANQGETALSLIPASAFSEEDRTAVEGLVSALSADGLEAGLLSEGTATPHGVPALFLCAAGRTKSGAIDAIQNEARRVGDKVLGVVRVYG